MARGGRHAGDVDVVLDRERDAGEGSSSPRAGARRRAVASDTTAAAGRTVIHASGRSLAATAVDARRAAPDRIRARAHASRHEGLAGADHLARADEHRADLATRRRGHLRLHLHRLEDHEHVARGDGLARFDDDPPDGRVQRGLDERRAVELRMGDFHLGLGRDPVELAGRRPPCSLGAERRLLPVPERRDGPFVLGQELAVVGEPEARRR